MSGFSRYMSGLTQPEKDSASACKEAVIEVVRRHCPGYTIVEHGSRTNGLNDGLADIDLVICSPGYGIGPGYGPDRGARLTAMKGLRDVFVKDQRFSALLIYGRHLVLELTDRRSQLKIQLTCNVPAIPAREYAILYRTEIPELKPIFHCIRHGLRVRGLTVTRYGGIGSYPLLNMIVTALKRMDGPRTEQIGSQLLFVLDFWADADLDNTLYLPDPPRTLNKWDEAEIRKELLEEGSADPYLQGAASIIRYNAEHRGRARKPNPSKREMTTLGVWAEWQLSLQDPANPINDLGRKISKIKHIQATFRAISERIKERVEMWDGQDEEQRREGGTASVLLDPLVASSFQAWSRRIEKVKRAARSFVPGSSERASDGDHSGHPK